MTGRVVLTVKGLGRFRTAHPWIYRDDVAEVDAADGDLVEVHDPGRHRIAHAFFSERSKITLRIVARGDEDPPSLDDFFAARIHAALERRKPLAEATDAMRIVASEGDGLPGLLVDRYADVITVSALVPAIEKNLTRIVPTLVELLAPKMVLARNDASVRRLEGLPKEVTMLHGVRVERVVVREGGLRFAVRPFTGQKTGLYLDQRNGRARMRGLVRRGGRVLDLCSYSGGFSLNALAAGAAEAVAVDSSAEALETARENAELNGLAGLAVIQGNVFEVARALVAENERFDVAVLDPPAFAKSRAEVSGAVRGYLDLNRRMLELMAPRGSCLTCSCSYHMTQPLFLDVLREACARSGRSALLRERVPPGIDHPVVLTLPESEYLKVFLLELD
jgi:23S rRNA (cytosine1962-C5)-methyltransferase